ncbi:hypothetical protein [Candidatus Bathycorpusculum sp.]|uniref:hypothetical protein n=1 Tax=Candidatus Bathycorpusculum sp. TaxID=2994959 RepID=UPI0028331AC1|nr:hypothetical protein [Candidatus Termitimicrobium sp.]MCL2432496.1 hypothetical protein [Candidatus Termitimicrobium sp.]
MKDSFKKLFSKRALTIVFVALLVLSIFNTYLILEGTHSSMSTTVVNYDFVLSQDGSTLKLKNMRSGYVIQPQSLQEALNKALSEGNSVYINQGTYTLNGDIHIINKLNARIISDGAIIYSNGHKIIIYGTDYTTSQYGLISGLTLINGTIHVENSFATTITNTKFINTTTGIEFLNTNTWSEYSKIEGCQFVNNTESIVFRSPINGTQSGKDIGNATSSYASTIIERCYFNIQDYAVGIKVEQHAEFSESRMQNLRFWMGENSQRSNQTALLLDGSMYQTLLLGVVFESFADDPSYMYAIDVGKNGGPMPKLDGGVSYLGNWTVPIHNPFKIGLRSDTKTAVKYETIVPVGTSGEFSETQSLECRPLTITDFKPKIDVVGNLKHDEIITVRIRIKYVDNAISNSVIHTFNTNGSEFLSDNEIIQLFSSQSVITAILVDAKTNTISTNAKVTVSSYGAT